jgi:Skp family chaperone for outer membrane proteins
MVANSLFYDVLENKPELNIPNAIFRRMQLVWLCSILEKSLWNNEIEVLNNAYRIFKGMEFPPDLEYSDEFLDLLVDFKTQLFIGNLMIDKNSYTHALETFARNLKITDRDEKKVQFINKKWMAKCVKRKKDIQFFESAEKMTNSWPESQFLERMRNFLMLIGTYLNQQYPASEIRRKLKNAKIDRLEESMSSDKTSSVALTNDDFSHANDNEFVQIKPERKLPIGFSKSPQTTSNAPVTKNVESASVEAPNEYRVPEKASHKVTNLSQVRSKTVPISEYATLFENLKSLYSLDFSDLSSNATGDSLNSNKTAIELVNLKKKIAVVYDGYAALQKHLNFLKEIQRTLEKKLKPVESTSNELPWTDDEEGSLDQKSQDSAEEYQPSVSEQNIKRSEETQLNDNDDSEEEVFLASEDGDELIGNESDISIESLYHFRNHLPKVFSNSPLRRSRRTPQKIPETKLDSYKVELVSYNGKDVYSVKCNNIHVLRRVSDGWVNASNIIQAASRGENEKIMIEESIPEPKENFKGSRSLKLHGVW